MKPSQSMRTDEAAGAPEYHQGDYGRPAAYAQGVVKTRPTMKGVHIIICSFRQKGGDPVLI